MFSLDRARLKQYVNERQQRESRWMHGNITATFNGNGEASTALPSNPPSRIPTPNLSRWDITHNNRSGSNDTPLADSYTFAD
jgi:hypothetical protein